MSNHFYSFVLHVLYVMISRQKYIEKLINFNFDSDTIADCLSYYDNNSTLKEVESILEECNKEILLNAVNSWHERIISNSQRKQRKTRIPKMVKINASLMDQIKETVKHTHKIAEIYQYQVLFKDLVLFCDKIKEERAKSLLDELEEYGMDCKKLIND